MGLSTEAQSTLEKWLDSLLGKVAGAILIGGWTTLMLWLTTDTAGRISTLCSGVLLLLLARLGLAYRQIRKDRDTLRAELSIADIEPDEPNLTPWQDTVVCFAWDHHPFGLEARDIVEEFPMNEDDFEDALAVLVKWDYLAFDDGRGPIGEGNEPGTYKITKKGRRYVEAKWPSRGDARREKIHRAIRRRFKA